MVSNPLNRNLYSYQEGVSTETALHRLVHKIEAALDKKQFCMVVFLDISGAFSNTSTKSSCGKNPGDWERRSQVNFYLADNFFGFADKNSILAEKF